MEYETAGIVITFESGILRFLRKLVMGSKMRQGFCKTLE
jgi:hypothetical protein